MNTNLEAFLTMIAKAEGTNDLGIKGYNILVGGKTFSSFKDHPRVRVFLKGIKVYSTAAGRYQILEKTYDHYKKILNLSDFSPASQDYIAIRILKERGALSWILKGDITTAITKVNKIWASLPGAGYNQRELKLEELLSFYRESGGQHVPV